MIKMATCLGALFLLPFVWSGRALSAQSSDEATWGLYASYVGGPPLWGDPCNVTYTVAPMDSPRIVEAVTSGLMIPIMEGVPRSEAQKGMKKHGRYFDDVPDGIAKKRPCDPSTRASDKNAEVAGTSPDDSSKRDQTILVSEEYSARGGGSDPYLTATVRASIEPERVSWIAWNNTPGLGSRGQLGEYGGGVDDFIELTVTGPSGQSLTVKMDQNDAFGAPFGTQHLIFGNASESPDIYRKIPFGPRAGEQLSLDEVGAFNSLMTSSGQYIFTFRFRDNTGGLGPHGHTKIYLLVKRR